jgi:hypothetical protein
MLLLVFTIAYLPFNSSFAVIIITLVVYDYMLTLTREIDYVWFSQWNIIKITFLVQRYLPFLDVIMISVFCAYLVLGFES